MNTIRTRLSLNTLIVLTLGMALTAVLAWQAVSGLYINTQRDNLLAQAKLLAAAFQGENPPENAQPYSQTANTSPGIHTRLLSDEGAVVIGLPLAKVDVQMPFAEQNAIIPAIELIQRPEIASALKGKPDTAIRKVLGSHRVLYAAAPVYASNGQISSFVYIATPLPKTGLPENIVLQLISSMVIAVTLATLAGGYLARQIADPLEGLALASEAIAGGNLKVTAPTNSKIKEFKRLGHTFNKMTENLRKSDEAKKAFIADVTHELRTPLTVIKGTIETLEDGAIDDMQGRSALLNSMGRETDRVIRLVNELLMLTRADAGSLPLEIRSFDFLEVVKQRCANLSNLAARKDVKIVSFGETRSDPVIETDYAGITPIMALADPNRISQVLDNLLDNAIRHSPPNSTITVRVIESRDGVECSVIDQGAGIPSEHLPFIFERFYRVDKSRNRKDGGAGLGLAIARALIQAQGGFIYTQSKAEIGTAITFWIRTPITSNNQLDSDK